MHISVLAMARRRERVQVEVTWQLEQLVPGSWELSAVLRCARLRRRRSLRAAHDEGFAYWNCACLGGCPACDL